MLSMLLSIDIKRLQLLVLHEVLLARQMPLAENRGACFNARQVR